MKKVLNWIKTTILVAIWILIILLYSIYMKILLQIELVLSYLTGWIDWIISRSMKFFRRSIRSLQRFMLEVIRTIIYR